MARKGDVILTIRIDDKNAPAVIRKLVGALSRLDASGKKAGAGVARTNRQVNKLGAAGGKGGAGIGQLTAAFGGAFIAAQSFMRVAGGLQRKIESVSKQVIMTADDFELLEKQLTTLTRSKEKAEAFFLGIKDFAKETPYQVKDLARSFNMLYPVFADKTLPMMKMIGDTAAGTGRSFEDTSMAMMRMATGDWGTEILRQLFIVKSDLDGVFGPNGKLVVSQEEAMGRLQTLMESRFGGMMGEMMDTVQGKVSNLGDVTDSLAASIGAELTPVTKEMFQLIIDKVGEIEAQGFLQEAARDLAAALRDNWDVILDIVDLLPEMAGLLAEVVRTLGEAVDTMGEINEGWGEWTGSGMSAAKELLDLLQLINFTLAGSVAMFAKVKEKRGLVTPDDLNEALAAVEERLGVPVLGAHGKLEMVKPVSAERLPTEWGPRTIGEEIAQMKAQGLDERGIEMTLRSRGMTDEQVDAALGRSTRPPPAPAPRGKGKAKTRAGEEYLRGQPGYTPAWEMELGYDVGGVADFTGDLGSETEKSMTEALDKFFKEYDDGLKAAEESNKRFADNMAGDIRSALEGTDATQIFARRLGAAVEAALSDAIRIAMAKMALSQALSAIPVIGPFLGALLGFDKGAVVAPTPGGTPGVVGEGGVPEAVVPLDVENLTTFIRGVSAGLNIPPAVVQVNVRGTDPWFVRAYESSRDGAANYRSRVH